MAVHDSSSLSYALDEAVTEVAFQTAREQDMFMPSLASIRPMTGNQEKVSTFARTGGYSSKPEGQEAAENRIVQQFQSTFSATPYAEVFAVTREMEDDDRWGIVDELGDILGEGGMVTPDEKLAELFNNIENTSFYSSEDGLSIANSAHLNTDSGNSQSNLGTESLTYSGVKTTRTAYRKLTGYNSDVKLTILGDELIVPVDLEEDAWQVVNSVAQPDTANNNGNMFNGRFTVYVWHRLSSTTAWGMMDSRLRRRNLRYYDRVGLEIASDAVFRSKTRDLGGYMRFALGVVDWRWVYWQSP